MKTNQEIDNAILDAIATGSARTAPDFQRLAGTDEARVVDNSLRRLKAKDLVFFDKAGEFGTPKVWCLRSQQHDASMAQSQAFVQQAPTLPPAASSPESAPTAESMEQSDERPTTAAKDEEEKNTNMNTESESNASVDAIDNMINEARAKRGDSTPAEAAKRVPLTEEQRKERDAKRESERAERKLQREQARQQKQAEREAAKKPAHMSKVDKAAERLPELRDLGQQMLRDITSNMSRDQVAALAAHLTHFNRTKATERALAQALKAGDRVRITGGDPRFVGTEGVVSKAQRIRCYVEVPGAKRPVYLFTSDVEVLAVEQAEAPAAANA